MRKFLSFLTAIMASVTLAFATTIKVPANTLDLQNPTIVTDSSWTGANAYYLDGDVLVTSGQESRQSTAKQTWITYASTGSTSSTWSALAPFKGSDYYTNKSYATLQAGRYTAYLVTNCDSVWLYGKNNTSAKYLQMNIYDVTSSTPTSIDDASVETTYAVNNTATTAEMVLKQALDASKKYLIVTTGVGNSNSRVFEIAFFRHPAAPATAHYYIAGTMTDWATNMVEMTAGNEDTLSVKIALEADSLYEFKVVKILDKDTTWYGNAEAATMTYGNSTGWWLTGSKNVGLQTTKADKYEFIFKANANNEISVVIPAPAPAPVVYYAKYADAKGDWNWKAMTEKEGKWLTDTIVYYGGGMNIHSAQEGDGKYFGEIAGVATNDTAYFSFNPTDSTLAATVTGKYIAPVVPTAHYYIAGSMTDWATNMVEMTAGNEDTLSVKIALEADSLYEFKVVKILDKDTTWYGNAEAATMTYGNSTGWWLTGSKNVGLQTTKAADYEFIFKANANNEISVVIPEPAPAPVVYYAKYKDDKDAWNWHALTEKEGKWLTDTIVYYGGGMNIHSAQEGEGKYFGEIAGVATNDTAYFTFNPTDSTLTATVTGKYVEPIVPTAKYYIAGTMTDWATNMVEMIAGNEDTLSVKIALEADSLYEFKVVKILDKDTTWYGNAEAATMTYGNSTGWWLTGSKNVGLQTTKADKYEFIFKANANNEISVVIPEPAPAPVVYYAKYKDDKDAWNWHALTEKEGKWLTDTIVYYGGGMNIHSAQEGDGKYFGEIAGVAANDTAYFTFNPADSTLTATVTGKYVEPIVPTAKYYIAGTMTDWATNMVEMTAGNEDTLSVKIALEADSLYEFKVVKVLGTDTTWFGNAEAATMTYGNSTGWWLTGSKNVGLQTTKADKYEFIFKANANNEISVVIPAPAPAPVVYYAKYADAKGDWNWHALTEKEGKWLTDTIVYYGGGMNIHSAQEGDGKYFGEIAGVAANDTAYFTFNPTDSTLAATVTGKYVEPIPADPTAAVKGSMNNWGDSIPFVLATDKKSASLTANIKKGNYEFKMIINGEWRSNGYTYHRDFPGCAGITANVEANMVLQLDVDGDYTFTWTFENDSLGIVFPNKPIPVLENGYYLVGDKYDWTPAATRMFVENTSAAGEYILADITLAADDSLKVVKVEDDEIITWYPAGDNYIVDANHAGVKTVYFRPDGQGGEGWFAGTIYIEPNSGEGVENTNANTKATKSLNKGVLIIEKNGVRYNSLGQVIR